MGLAAWYGVGAGGPGVPGGPGGTPPGQNNRIFLPLVRR
jgi:hypothetical protein